MWDFKIFDVFSCFILKRKLILAGIVVSYMLSRPIMGGVVKGVMTVDYARGQYSLYSFLQNETGFKDFWLGLSDDDRSRLIDIKGYPSLDKNSFLYDAPVNMPKKNNAFSLSPQGNIIAAASLVFESLKTYENYASSHDYEFLARYLKSIAEDEDSGGTMAGSQKYFRDIMQSLPPKLLSDFMLQIFKASSLVGAPIDVDDGNVTNLALLINQLLSRSAVQLQVPIGRGFAQEDADLLSRAALVFTELNLMMTHHTEGEWELVPAEVDFLSLSTEGYNESYVKRLLQINLLAKAKVDKEVIRGLKFTLPEVGATMTLELPYFTALGWGLDPSLNIDEQLKNINFTYQLPGKFQQVKRIPVSLDGKLECNFKASVVAHMALKIGKDADGVILDDSGILFDDRTGDKFATCELFVALENDSHYSLTDGNGTLNIGDPALFMALGVPNQYSSETVKTINRLQGQITLKTREFMSKYGKKFEAAKSLKDAYMDAAMKDLDIFMVMPLPEVMRTKEKFEHFGLCYHEIVQKCRYESRGGMFGAMTIRHKCWSETENQCNEYWRWVETYYSESVPQYYFKNLNFERTFEGGEEYSFTADTFLKLVITASNKVCLSNRESIKSRTPCNLDEQKVDQLMRQQDNFIEQGLGVSSIEGVDKFDAPIESVPQLKPYSL